MKKTLRHSIAILLAGLMIFGGAPLAGIAGIEWSWLGSGWFDIGSSAATYSGTCGDNVTWTLDTDTGILHISGTGTMTGFSSLVKPPWDIYRINIDSIIIDNGVSSIGAWAFRYSNGLTSVTIPSSITSIGSAAFEDCVGLTSVSIPASVTDIGDRTFSACSGLTNISVSGSNTVYSDIDGVLFNKSQTILLCMPAGKTGTYTIPDSVTSINHSAFYCCNTLTCVTIPGSVTSIGGSAFEGCSGLLTMTIPNGVTGIGDYTFSGCSGLMSLTIPGSVTSIGNYAIRNCSALIGITIPSGVTSIGDSTFLGCSGLASVAIPSGVSNIGNYSFSGCSGLTTVTIPNSVTSIGEFAFHGCSGLTDMIIPSNVGSIGYRAFYKCSGLTNISVSSSNAEYSDVNGALFNKSQTTLLCLPAGKTGTYTIPDNVTLIGNSACSYCVGLTGVTIPSSVTAIGNYAFLYCSGLTGIAFAANAIGYAAFDGCSSLMSITIPANVSGIGYRAFSNCRMLTNISVSGSNTDFSDVNGVLFNKSQTTLLCMPAGKTGTYTIPASVSIIADYAFCGCNITALSIPSGITSIGPCAFQDSSELTSITIPDSVTSIGTSAFYGCSRLASVAIPSGVSNIGNYSFSGCSGLTNITIPSSVTSIGSSAFSSCSGLTSITIPDSVTSIGASAFSNSSGLTSIIIPDSVTSIGTSAFLGCSGLLNISVSADNTVYSDIDGVLLSKSRTTLLCLPAGKTGDYTIPDNVTSIGSSAFSACSGLTGVTIPDSVIVIGNDAFKDCGGLVSIIVSAGNGLYSDVDGVLFNKSQTTLLYMPSGKTGTYKIAGSVTSIGALAFYNCSALTSVTVPGSVTNIGSLAFKNCPFLNIYCFEDTYALSYAVSNNIPYRLLYTITYHANGGDVAPEQQIKVQDADTALSSQLPQKARHIQLNVNGGEPLEPAELDIPCILDSWNTMPDGNGVSFAPGAMFNLNTNTILYAQWNNPAAGNLPAAVKPGVTFDGWYTQAEGGTQVTSETVLSGDTEIFAHWRPRYSTSVQLATAAIKTQYFAGDTLQTDGISLNVAFDNGENDILTSGFICSPMTMRRAGTQPITVTFEGKTVTFNVTVQAVELTGITVLTPPLKTQYNKNETFNSDGLTLTASYNNGATKTVSTGFSAVYDFGSAGSKEVQITYTEGGLSAQTHVTVTVVVNNIVGGDPATADAGATVDIPVKITGNQGLMGFSLNIGYDAAVFTPVSVSAGAMLAGGMLNDSIATAQPGQFKVVWTGSEDVTGDGILFTVTFSVNANAIGAQNIALSYNQEDTFNENWDDVVLHCGDIPVTVNNPNYVPPPSLNASPATVTAGDNIGLPVSITDSSGMSQFKIHLTYDPAIYTYISVSKGAALLTGDISASAAGGVLTVTWTGTSADGVIFTPVFRTAEYKEGRHDIALSYDPANTVFATPGTVMTCAAVEVTLVNPFAGQSAWVEADHAQGAAGTTVNVPIQIFNNQGLMGFGITVNYDPAVLTPLSVTRGTVTSAGMFDSTLGAGSNGSFKVIWNNTGDVSANGTLMVVSFTVNPGAATGDSPITLTYTQADTFNEAWQDVVLDCRASTITITDAPLLLAAKAGSTTVLNRGNGLLYGLAPGMSVNDLLAQYLEAAPANTTIAVNGSVGTGTKVELIDTGSGATLDSLTIVIFGDVNGDGNIDSSDAGIIVDYENFMIEFEPAQFAVFSAAADLNNDGNVDSSDAGVIVDVENFLLDINQATGQFFTL